MPSDGAPLELLVSDPQNSAQMAALKSLATGAPISLFQVAYKSVTNFALEHNACTLASTPTGTAAGQKMTFHMSKAGDLCTSVWLECVCPRLQTEQDGLVSYVWGLGYAMIQYAQFNVSNHSQEDLSGDWMEIHEELHQPAGRRLQECVLKLDRVTLPEMADISTGSQGVTLYTPIPFWFTKGTHAALPLISMNCHDLDVVVVLRSIADITVAFPANMKADANNPVVKTENGSDDVTWADFSFSLWAGQVYLDTQERNYFASTEHEYLMKSVHQYTSHAQDEGTPFGSSSQVSLNNIPFNHPVVDLVWVIADGTRRAKYSDVAPAANNQFGRARSDATDAIPYASGVRALYGVMAGGQRAEEVGATHSGLDWNVLRSGSQVLDTTLSAATSGIVAGIDIRSSAAVKEHRNDGLNGCLHLPGNRFDYRMAGTGTRANGDGTTTCTLDVNELEPMKSVKITFNNQDRVSPDLKAQYFRQVQPAEHFANVPRKGIYCYSFAMNASSPFPNGTCNFSRIDDKTVEVTKNASHTTVTNGTEGLSTNAELYLWAEYFQIYSVKQNSTGKVFGN